MFDDFDFLQKREINFKLLFITFAVIGLLIYIGYFFVGERSISYYFDLENQKQVLDEEVSKIQKKNAKLQKEYFELKDIEGSQ